MTAHLTPHRATVARAVLAAALLFGTFGRLGAAVLRRHDQRVVRIAWRGRLAARLTPVPRRPVPSESSTWPRGTLAAVLHVRQRHVFRGWDWH